MDKDALESWLRVVGNIRMSMKVNLASNIENQQVQDIVQTVPLREFIHAQYLKYIAHVCRHENSSIPKKLLLAMATKNT